MRNEQVGKTRNPPDEHPFITTAEAAAMLRLSPRTLEKMRQRGEGPEYFKIQGRVWYTREKVEAYIATTLRRSTFDPPARPHTNPQDSKAEQAVDPGEAERSTNSANP